MSPRLADFLRDYHLLVHRLWIEERWDPSFDITGMLQRYAPPDESGIVLRVLENLPKGFYVESIDDLRDILEEHFYSAGSIVMEALDSGTEQQIVEIEESFLRLVAEEVYDFEVPMFGPFTQDGGDSVPFELIIGGRQHLRFVHRRLEHIPLKRQMPNWTAPQSFQCVTLLCGQAKAVHWTGALRAALALSEEVTGTHLAVDLAHCSAPTAQHLRNVKGAEAWQSVLLSRTVDGAARSIDLSWQQVDAMSRTLGHWPESSSLHLKIMSATAQIASDGEMVPADHDEPIATARRIRSYALAPFSRGGIYPKRLRTAARFLTKAVRAESPADSFLFTGTCLEALLVSGSEAVSERLSDAVGLILGRTFGEREEVKERVKKLYNIRSRYVHDGVYEWNERERMLCLDIVKRVLAVELRRLTIGEDFGDTADPRGAKGGK